MDKALRKELRTKTTFNEMIELLGEKYDLDAPLPEKKVRSITSKLSVFVQVSNIPLLEVEEEEEEIAE